MTSTTINTFAYCLLALVAVDRLYDVTNYDTKSKGDFIPATTRPHQTLRLVVAVWNHPRLTVTCELR